MQKLTPEQVIQKAFGASTGMTATSVKHVAGDSVMFGRAARFARTLALTAALSSPLAACVTDGNSSLNNIVTWENAARVGGAAAGIAAGSFIGGGTGKLIAAGVGGVAGWVIGGELYKALTPSDKKAVENAQAAATRAEVGREITWNNPDSGNSGTITPVKEAKNPEGQYCREYQTTVTVGGKKQKGYGTACRQPDGSWKFAADDRFMKSVALATEPETPTPFG